MQIQFEQDFRRADTLLPNIFITQYMQLLDAPALKCYLLLLYLAQTAPQDVSLATLARHLNVGEAEIKLMLGKLLRHNLVLLEAEAEKITIVDLKKIAWQSEVAWAASSKEAELLPAVIQERLNVLRQINDTFYQGLIPNSVDREIQKWFTNYQFEPTVVYAVFAEAEKYDKLNGAAYMGSIAANWAKQGIKSFADLTVYYDKHSQLKTVCQEIKSKLNLKADLTTYQQELVRRWLEEWHFDLPIIEEALRSTTGLSQPNLRYVDKVLASWQAAGLGTVSEIRAAESKRQEQNTKKAAASTGKFASAGIRKTRGSRANFAQRQYTEADLADLYQDLAAVPAEAAANTSKNNGIDSSGSSSSCNSK